MSLCLLTTLAQSRTKDSAIRIQDFEFVDCPLLTSVPCVHPTLLMFVATVWNILTEVKH